MAEISKEINIKYRWWNHDLESIDAKHAEALEETAYEQIGTMMDQGFTSGEMIDNIHMHDSDPEDGIEYNGWCELKEVTTMETKDEKAAQAVKDAAPELLEVLRLAHNHFFGDGSMPGAIDLPNKIRKAIDSATGE